MKKHIIVLSLILIGFNVYGQFTYEDGYFIDDNNNRIECLINDRDWKYNPIEFDYKMSINREIKTATINSIKEFGIYGYAKYLRATVEIDTSSKKLDELSALRAPQFKKKQLFLNVVLEGKANLYSYKESGLTRYFYKLDDVEIEQLIFKTYRSGKYIQENSYFKQQLAKDLNCSSIKRPTFEKLLYKKRSLLKVFKEYNKCSNAENTTFESKRKRKKLTISVRPRVNHTSFSARNTVFQRENIDFKSNINYGIGLELEYVLPFNRNKWSLTLEPTFYQKYEDEQLREYSLINGGDLLAKASYTSIELPFNLKYYMFLNTKTKFFLNTSFVLPFSRNTYVEYVGLVHNRITTLEVHPVPNLAFGVGLQYSRISAEVRYNTTRSLFRSFNFGAEYKLISLVFGFSLIQI